MSGIGFFKHTQYNQMNAKFKTKYKKLKRIIKEYVLENAALCDQISNIQESITVIKEERRFLLKKLMEQDDMQGTDLNITEQVPHIPGKRGPKKRLNSDASNKSRTSGGNVKSVPIPKKQEVPAITVDSQGRPVFPINLGPLTIHAVGEVVPDNPNFHTENWVYPVGYMATRVYSHPKEPQRKCTFTCKILDNSGIPQFQIIPDSDFDHVFFGESANICHLSLLETIVRVSDVKNLPLRAQGEIFFGLGHPTVVTLVKSSPNISRCQNFKHYEIEAGVEENDPTLNFEALQKLIAISVYHTVPEIKEEPPDELLE